jgi:hypothetical protein
LESLDEANFIAGCHSWLLPHGITAALTLMLGPLQFSSRSPRRHLNWHRISGRLYVAGVAVGVPLRIVIEAIKYRIGVAPVDLAIRPDNAATRRFGCGWDLNWRVHLRSW